MITLDYTDMQKHIDEVSAMGSKIRPSPVFFYPYLKRVLKADWERLNPEYPMTIKIPKDAKALLKGDFEPAQVIVLEKPVTLDDGTPIWFNRSDEEVFLRFGYENLDARHISSIKMNMEYIHGFLGGASGHGKSVTLNAMLGGVFYEYAPWEVEVHLSDAKIIEFKKYGVNHRIPHISTIAATEDADFVVSVLEKAFDEMNMRAKIFGNIGASNLKNFRKKTGLALPRVLIVMDEVESTFKLAGRQANHIADLIDGFARLGRAAGYHLFLATQNMSSDIPSSAIGQIRLRCCLGANEKTSMSVLANAGATDNYGRIGRCIVNTEVLNGGNTTPFNVKFQTPYITDEEFEDEMPFLEAKGKEVGYNKVMAFYDEEDMKSVEAFDPIASKAMERMHASGEISQNAHPICLGSPAFVSPDPDELLKIWLDHKDVENILVSSTSTERVAAQLHNITRDLSANGYVIQLFTTDPDQASWIVKPMVTIEARNAEQPPLSTIGSLVRKRMFLLQVDSLAKGAKYERETVEKAFREDGVPTYSWGNDLLCRRVVAATSLLNQKDWEDVRYLFPNTKAIYEEFLKCNCLVEPLTPDKFTKAAFILGDLSKIVGYGRDTKSRPVSNLKKAMQDSNRVGVIYVVFSRSMEGINELASGLRYVIFDSPDGKDWGRMRAEEPASLGSRLAMLFDNMDNDKPYKKYKRTLLHAD